MRNQKEAWSVSEVLGVGKAAAIRIEALAARFETSERDVHKQIAIERGEGAPIVTDGQRGYYLADPETEEGREAIERTRRRLQALGRNIVKVAGTMGAR